jgi:hypothetical protein
MFKMVNNKITTSYLQRKRTYQLTQEAMMAFGELPKGARKLLFEILSHVKPGCTLEDLVVTGEYADFGYERRQHFYRDRKALIDADFLCYQDKDHYVNPVMIGYETRRQLDWLHSLFNLKKKPVVNMGQHK